MRSAIVASISFYWSLGAAFLTAFTAPVPVLGQPGPTRYVATVWQTEQGLPQNSIEYMLQDRDGYLWLSTHAGLVRFDGVNFKLFGSEELPGLVIRRVSSIHQDRSGVLWIGTPQSGLIIRLHDGTSSNYTVPDGILPRSIRSIREDSAGKLWFNIAGGIASFVDGRLQAYKTHGGRAVSEFLLQAQDQSMWFRSGTDFVRFGVDGSIATLAGGYWCYEDRQGSIWIVFRDQYRLVRYSQGRFTEVPLPPITQRHWRSAYPDLRPDQVILATATDIDGALLLLTPAGLIRAANGKVGSPEALPLPENIREAPKVSTLLVDREGNRWVGTQGGGLFRFRRAPVTAYGKDEGLSDSEFHTVFEDREGRIWMGGDSVYWFDGQRFHPVPGPAGVYGIGQLKNGDVWIGGSDGLYLWRSGVLTRFPLSVSVNRLVQDGQGALWALVAERYSSRRLYRFRGGKFEPADADVTWVGEDRDGGLWIVNQLRPALRYIRDGKTVLYDERHGLPRGRIDNIHQDSTGTTWFAASWGGLYRFRDGTFQAIPGSSGLTSEPINAMQDDGRGNLWFSSNRGIARVGLKELNDFADGRVSSLSPVWYGAAEGMKSIECNAGFPGAWRARDGRIWFASVRGVVAVDPNAGDRLPPTVIIEEAWAGRVKLGGGGRTSVKAGSNTFDFTFTGLSLTAPEKQRFKYQLEPYDKDWVDVGTRRTAHYTNMPPGDYSFQVMAANSYGIWSVRSAGVRFALQPQFYQTNWFRSACVAAFGLLLWLAYQFRIRQLQQLFNMRLEERVQERTRIARELHDTLLQTSQAALIHMQAAYNLLARRREGAAEVLQQAINVSEAGIAEGREAIQNMRLSTVIKNDLARALRLAGDQLAAQGSATFELSVEGSSRDVHPILRDEIYNIALEAMRNAFKHSEAHAIEARIFYGDSLRMRIRDDGKGMDPAIVTQGRSGHFGLAGMRERADRIGGKLDVCSSPGGGTKIELSIPGAIAFGVPGAGSLFRRFRRNNKSKSAAQS